MSLATQIRGLSPFGPILGMEMRIASRRKRNHFLRIFYLATLLLILLAFWASNAPSQYGGVAYRMQQQAELGQGFFATFSIFCVCCMGLIAPILTSTAINSERLGNTLPTLLMTPISSWQIVAGKLFARLLLALLLIGLSLPVLAVVRLLGGVELWQMGAVMAVCITFALFSAAMGLFYSSIVNRAYAVILLCYATHFLLYFLFPMLIVLVVQSTMRFSTRSGDFYAFMAMINPVLNVAFISIPGAPLSTAGLPSSWLPAIALHLGATMTLLVASSFIVRRQERHKGGRPLDSVASAPQILPPPLPDASSASAHAPAPVRPHQPEAVSHVGNNPVLWRERRRPLVAPRFALRSAVASVLLLIITYGCFAMAGGYSNPLTEEELQCGFAVVFHGLFWLLVAVLSATAIAQEKESDTWTLLLTAPLSARQIVVGKLLGIIRRLFWPMMLVVAHFTLFTITGVISPIQMLLMLWIMLSFNSIWAATGLYLSIRMRKVTSAAVINLLLPILIYAIVPIAALAIGELIWHDDDFIEATAISNPYVYQIVNFSYRTTYIYQGSKSVYLPPLGHISVTTFNWLTAAIGLAHVALAWLVLSMTIRKFNALVGRAGQNAPVFSYV